MTKAQVFIIVSFVFAIFVSLFAWWVAVKPEPIKAVEAKAVAEVKVEEPVIPPTPVVKKEESLCTSPRFKLGDLVVAIGPNWGGQIGVISKFKDERNDTCWYTVVHYYDDNSEEEREYWEFQLRKQ